MRSWIHAKSLCWVASMQDGELSVRASVGRPSGVEPSLSVAASAHVDWFKHAARDTAQPATRTTRAVASAATCLEAYLSTACRGGLGGIAAPNLFVPVSPPARKGTNSTGITGDQGTTG